MPNETKKEKLSECCNAKAFRDIHDEIVCHDCNKPFIPSSPNIPTGELKLCSKCNTMKNIETGDICARCVPTGEEKCNKCNSKNCTIRDGICLMCSLVDIPIPEKTGEDWEKNFIEIGADIEHTRWSKWQKYFFSKCLIKPQGQVGGMDDRFVYFALPKDLYERWNRQIETAYGDLSETEKESDRAETRNYLMLIKSILISKEKQWKDEMAGKIRNLKHPSFCDDSWKNSVLSLLSNNQEDK